MSDARCSLVDLTLLLGALAACQPSPSARGVNEPVPAPAPVASASVDARLEAPPSEAAVAASPGPAQSAIPVDRRVIGLVVNEEDGELSVSDAVEMNSDDLGEPSTWNLGYGPDVFRWQVLDASGGRLTAGEIRVSRAKEVPPRPNEPAVHFTPKQVSFLVRVRFPEEARAVTISSADGKSKPVTWKPRPPSRK